MGDGQVFCGGSDLGRSEDRNKQWREQLRSEQKHAREDVRFEDIALQPVSAGQWRVVNTAASEEVFGLLGFVQLVGGRFQVTFLSEPETQITVPTEHAARLAFTTPDSGSPRTGTAHR